MFDGNSSWRSGRSFFYPVICTGKRYERLCAHEYGHMVAVFFLDKKEDKQKIVFNHSYY